MRAYGGQKYNVLRRERIYNYHGSRPDLWDTGRPRVYHAGS